MKQETTALDLVRRLRAARGRMSQKNDNRALLGEAAQAVEQLAARLFEAEHALQAQEKRIYVP